MLVLRQLCPGQGQLRSPAADQGHGECCNVVAPDEAATDDELRCKTREAQFHAGFTDGVDPAGMAVSAVVFKPCLTAELLPGCWIACWRVPAGSQGDQEADQIEAGPDQADRASAEGNRIKRRSRQEQSAQIDQREQGEQ